ncbi:MAG: hypothetical protein ACPGU4_00950 [Flavobacteriales bacterium]
MKTIKLLTTALLIGATSVAFAQKTKISTGDFTELKGQTEVNLVFDYSELECVGGAPFSKKKKPESEWVEEMRTKKNNKEAGTGDDWVKRWNTAKTASFEPNFEIKMSEMWKGTTVKRGLDNAKYTLVIKVLYTDPGFSIGVSSSDAWLNADISVVETGSDKAISSLSMTGIKGASATKSIPGMPVDIGGMTFEKRLGESYEKMAKSLYKKVFKKAFK